MIEKEIIKERKASSLLLSCSLDRRKIMTNDAAKIRKVIEYVKSFLFSVWQNVWPMFVQIISSGSGALLTVVI